MKLLKNNKPSEDAYKTRSFLFSHKGEDWLLEQTKNKTLCREMGQWYLSYKNYNKPNDFYYFVNVTEFGFFSKNEAMEFVKSL